MYYKNTTEYWKWSVSRFEPEQPNPIPSEILWTLLASARWFHPWNIHVQSINQSINHWILATTSLYIPILKNNYSRMRCTAPHTFRPPPRSGHQCAFPVRWALPIEFRSAFSSHATLRDNWALEMICYLFHGRRCEVDFNSSSLVLLGALTKSIQAKAQWKFPEKSFDRFIRDQLLLGCFECVHLRIYSR